VGFFAREQLKILLWRDGVFVAESVRFVIVRYHQLPKHARGSVFAVWCACTHARQDRLVDVGGNGSHARWFGLFAMRSYALKPIPQRMDLREHKHAFQSLSHEPIQHKSNLTINFDNGNQW
jgi:hypothetical protein